MSDPTKTEDTAPKSGLFSTPPAVAAPAETAAAAPVVEPETVDNEPLEAPEINEREMLMSRARMMGIEFSNNIGTQTLRDRIRSKMEADEQTETEDEEEEEAADPEPVVAETNALTGEAPNAPKKSLRQTIYDREMRLVRLRITNLDPKKKDLPGEIFTVANEYLGTVRKFVPFGEVTDEGFHVPFCIYTMMDERKFLNIRTIKDKRTGAQRPETQMVREFALEILPPLTEEDLARLANAQAAAGSIDTF